MSEKNTSDVSPRFLCCPAVLWPWDLRFALGRLTFSWFSLRDLDLLKVAGKIYIYIYSPNGGKQLWFTMVESAKKIPKKQVQGDSSFPWSQPHSEIRHFFRLENRPSEWVLKRIFGVGFKTQICNNNKTHLKLQKAVSLTQPLRAI